MSICPICQKTVVAGEQEAFALKSVEYHAACIPDCEECGKPIVFERTCASIYTSRVGHEVVGWKARHKRCY